MSWSYNNVILYCHCYCYSHRRLRPWHISTPDPTEDTTLTHHHHNLTTTLSIHVYTTPQHLQNITSILQHHHNNNNSNDYHHHTHHLLILVTSLLWCWHSLNVLWMHGWTCDVMEWCKKWMESLFEMTSMVYEINSSDCMQCLFQNGI